MYATSRTYEERNMNKPKECPPTKMLVGVPATTMKGHSAFLTFALRPTSDMLEAMQRLKTTTTTTAATNVSADDNDVMIQSHIDDQED